MRGSDIYARPPYTVRKILFSGVLHGDLTRTPSPLGRRLVVEAMLRPRFAGPTGFTPAPGDVTTPGAKRLNLYRAQTLLLLSSLSYDPKGQRIKEPVERRYGVPYLPRQCLSNKYASVEKRPSGSGRPTDVSSPYLMGLPQDLNLLGMRPYGLGGPCNPRAFLAFAATVHEASGTTTLAACGPRQQHLTAAPKPAPW